MAGKAKRVTFRFSVIDPQEEPEMLHLFFRCVGSEKPVEIGSVEKLKEMANRRHRVVFDEKGQVVGELFCPALSREQKRLLFPLVKIIRERVYGSSRSV